MRSVLHLVSIFNKVFKFFQRHSKRIKKTEMNSDLSGVSNNDYSAEVLLTLCYFVPAKGVINSNLEVESPHCRMIKSSKFIHGTISMIYLKLSKYMGFNETYKYHNPISRSFYEVSNSYWSNRKFQGRISITAGI